MKTLLRKKVRNVGNLAFLWITIGALLSLSCGPAKPPSPNVIFLTVDTLRADHLALYGYERNTMPGIEEFSKEAVVFQNAVVPRGATRPSYASMLTGLYPHRHGVRDNHTMLHEQLVTLPERLREAGYTTAGFVSNYVLVQELSGMDQGFDHYDDFVVEQKNSGFERRAADTVQAILGWLDEKPEAPFFLFTNFIDPHGPYTPPPHLREEFQSKKERHLRLDQIPEYQRIDGETDFYDYVDRYDAEIRYVDEALQVLIGELKSRGLWENSIVVFLADHGESLGEHDLYFEHHWNLWEETNRIPLAIRLPKGSDIPASDRRVQTVVSGIDLFPTVLDLLRLPVPENIDGTSMKKLLAGEEQTDRAVFLEYPNTEHPVGQMPEWYSIRTAEHSLVRIVEELSGRTLMEAYFPLESDPYQLNAQQLNQGNRIHRSLQRRLGPWVATAKSYKLPFSVTRFEMPDPEREALLEERAKDSKVHRRTLTPEQIERLRSLGYIDDGKK